MQKFLFTKLTLGTPCKLSRPLYITLGITEKIIRHIPVRNNVFQRTQENLTQVKTQQQAVFYDIIYCMYSRCGKEITTVIYSTPGTLTVR